jgi:hypothetical protein
VPLKATGSCSWCWKDSFHIQRLVNIVDLKVYVSYCGINGAIVVDGEREYAARVGEGAIMVYGRRVQEEESANETEQGLTCCC